MPSCVLGWTQITAPTWKSGDKLREPFLVFPLRRFQSDSELPSPTYYQTVFSSPVSSSHYQGLHPLQRNAQCTFMEVASCSAFPL